jgi:hypothetical protein
MIKCEKITAIIIFSLLVFFTPESGFPIEISNPLFTQGITNSGHSGLLSTKGGTSIAPGKLIVGIFTNYFDRDFSAGASEKVVKVPITLTYGLPYHIEVAGRISYSSLENSSKESGLSEGGISLKWSFLQKEGMSYPSFAAGISSNFAMAGKNKGLSDFSSYNLVFFLSGSGLIDFGPYHEYAFSLYGEGRAVLNDLGETDKEEHGVLSAGALFPLTFYPDLGFFIEATGTVNRGFGRNKDFIRVTPAFRLKLRRASFTAGTSYVHPNQDDQDSYFEYTLSLTMGF